MLSYKLKQANSLKMHQTIIWCCHKCIFYHISILVILDLLSFTSKSSSVCPHILVWMILDNILTPVFGLHPTNPLFPIPSPLHCARTRAWFMKMWSGGNFHSFPNALLISQPFFPSLAPHPSWLRRCFLSYLTLFQQWHRPSRLVGLVLWWLSWCVWINLGLIMSRDKSCLIVITGTSREVKHCTVCLRTGTK